MIVGKISSIKDWGVLVKFDEGDGEREGLLHCSKIPGCGSGGDKLAEKCSVGDKIKVSFERMGMHGIMLNCEEFPVESSI